MREPLHSILLNTAQGATHTRVLSEHFSASDGSEGEKCERQMQMLLLTKQKLELTLKLQRLQRQTEDQGQHQEPTDRLASARRSTVLRVPAPPAEREEPCTGWDSLEEADDLTSAAPTRQTSDDVDLNESFWNLPSPSRRGPLLVSSAKKTLLKSEQGPESFLRAPASLVRSHSLPHVHLGSNMPSHDVLPPSAVESLIVKGRVGVLPPDTRTQIPTALLAVMKRKGKLHLVQGLSIK